MSGEDVVLPEQPLGGRYRITELLGAGLTGNVYRARDELGDHGDVAIKVLHATRMTDEVARQRFRREAETLASVDHPHVVRVLAAEIDGAEAAPYFVMPVVEGRTLDAYVADHGRVDESTAVAIADQILDALSAVHARGVLHRDLKPANVIVANEMPLHVTVLDFGHAKARLDGTPAATARGMVLGTPMYMSPEQLAGEVIDATADLYAVACCLIEMTAGALPFINDDEELLSAKLLGQHVAPPVSPVVAHAIGAMLAARPDARPRDAEAARVLLRTGPPRRRSLRALDAATGAARPILDRYTKVAPKPLDDDDAETDARSLGPPKAPTHVDAPSEPAPLTPSRPRRSWVALVAAMTVAGAAAWFFAVRDRNPRTALPAPTAAQRTTASPTATPRPAHRLRLTSTPSGSTVRLAGRPLGVTPLEVSADISSVELSLSAHRTVTVDLQGESKHVVLDRIVAPKPRPARPTPPVRSIKVW